MAGPWLRFRGHLDNITNRSYWSMMHLPKQIFKPTNSQYGGVPEVQRQYKQAGIETVVVGDHNYGEDHLENTLQWNRDFWVKWYCEIFC